MLRAVFRTTLVVMLIGSLSGLALAEDKKASREREALRRAQQQVQKATQELAGVQEKLTAAEAQKAQLETKLADELGGAQARAKAESGRAQKLQQQLQAMTAERDAAKQQSAEQKTAADQRILELTTRLATVEKELASAREKGQQLEAVRGNQTRQIAACEDRNANMYSVGRSLIEECRERIGKDSATRWDVFSGITRVGLENRLEAQRDLLDAQKTPPAGN